MNVSYTELKTKSDFLTVSDPNGPFGVMAGWWLFLTVPSPPRTRFRDVMWIA